MENPGGHIIERLEFTEGELHHNGEKKAETTQIKVTSSDAKKTAPSIVRPSSLNYKISLLDAVTAFVNKDKQTDQFVEVELEEPISKKLQNYEILDDALYIINKAMTAKLIVTVTTNKGANANGPGGQNAAKSIAKATAEQAAWEREEETIRKKLERNAVNMMKNKVAGEMKSQVAGGKQGRTEPDD